MGRGIAAAVPLTFGQGRRGLDEKIFVVGFLDCYNMTETEGKKLYTIKSEILLNNYKSFLEEFYDLIGEDFQRETKLTFDEVPNASNLEEFMDVFSKSSRGGWTPFTDYGYSFSTIGCDCDDYWMFYSGSYKAELEEYCSLAHFEKILAKAMDNPLAKAVKFGMFG